jgi:hypothetical protein
MFYISWLELEKRSEMEGDRQVHCRILMLLAKKEVVDENQSVKASRGKNERTNTVAFRPDPSK